MFEITFKHGFIVYSAEVLRIELELLSASGAFESCHFSPTPVKPLKIEKTGERRLKKVDGKK